MKLMQKNPEKRYASAKGLFVDLNMILYRILNGNPAPGTSPASIEDRLKSNKETMARLTSLKDDQIFESLRTYESVLGIQDLPIYDVRPAHRYVAREQERDEMLRVCRDVLTGEQEACLIAVHGEGGTGITRLVRELGVQIRESGHAYFGI